MRAFQRTQRRRGLRARSWGLVCLALFWLLVPPTVTPCPVRAGLTSSSAASCCAVKDSEPEAARPAPARACCARKAAAEKAAAEMAAQPCKMQGACCCKARPTSGQVPVTPVSRVSPDLETSTTSSVAVIEPDSRSDARLSFHPAPLGRAVGLNQLLCRWTI